MNKDKEYIKQTLADRYLVIEDATFSAWLEMEINNSPESFDCFFDRSWDEIDDDDREERAEELREIGREVEETREAAARELLNVKMCGCCGSGRHLITWNSDKCAYEYKHDSARERVGVDESEVKFACYCSTEDCFDEAVEFVVYDEDTNRWTAEYGSIEDSLREAGSSLEERKEEMYQHRKEICEAYAAWQQAWADRPISDIGWDE